MPFLGNLFHRPEAKKPVEIPAWVEALLKEQEFKQSDNDASSIQEQKAEAERLADLASSLLERMTSAGELDPKWHDEISEMIALARNNALTIPEGSLPVSKSVMERDEASKLGRTGLSLVDEASGTQKEEFFWRLATPKSDLNEDYARAVSGKAGAIVQSQSMTRKVEYYNENDSVLFRMVNIFVAYPRNTGNFQNIRDASQVECIGSLALPTDPVKIPIPPTRIQRPGNFRDDLISRGLR